jgi:hypothetical protein
MRQEEFKTKCECCGRKLKIICINENIHMIRELKKEEG